MKVDQDSARLIPMNFFAVIVNTRIVLEPSTTVNWGDRPFTQGVQLDFNGGENEFWTRTKKVLLSPDEPDET